MEDDGDFVPDYAYKTTVGVVSTRNSKIRYRNNVAYVSVHNKLNLWNVRTQEIVGVYGTRRHGISCFEVCDDHVIIGHEDGGIELVASSGDSRTFRLHRRRVSQIVLCPCGFISSSVDGTICMYDIMLEELKVAFAGNSVAVERIVLAGGLLFALCADKALRIWRESSADLDDVYAFDDHPFSLAVRGNEALVILRSGSSFLLDLATRERKSFESFSKIRNVVQRDSLLAVQTQKKFVLYKITKDSSLGLDAVLRSESSDLFTQFDFSADGLVFLTRSNGLEIVGMRDVLKQKTLFAKGSVLLNKTSSIISHATEVLQVEVRGRSVYTLSKERVIIWRRTEENKYRDAIEGVGNGACNADDLTEYTKDGLEARYWIDIERGCCFCLFNDLIIIGKGDGILVYQNSELRSEMKIGKVNALCSHNDILSVCVDTAVTFYDADFNVVDVLNVPEPVVAAKFTPCGLSFCVSALDNKIYVFNFPGLDLRISLYGHSLPVRSFSISEDSRLLLSCGADKLVKLWGLEFGECKKTFVGNALNAEFISVLHDGSGLFMFSDREIHYYRGTKKLKVFRSFSTGIVKPGDNFFVCTADRGVSLFMMQKYELLAEDESAEEEHAVVGAVADGATYERFLDFIEKLEESPSSSRAAQFYMFLEKVDFAELSSMLRVLDRAAVDLLIGIIEASAEKNVVLNIRMFLLLLSFHTGATRSHASFHGVRTSLLEKACSLRDLAGGNEAQLLVETSFERADTE